MLVPGAVVTYCCHVGGLLDVGHLDQGRGTEIVLLCQHRARGSLQQGEGLAGVRPGHAHDLLAGLLTDLDGSGKAPLVAQGAVYQAPDVVCHQWVESQEQGAGQERGDDAEGGVLRGGGNESDPAVLHAGKESVLLGTGEAVDLIDEKHRLLPRRQTPSGIGDHGTHVLDARGHRRQLHEASPTAPRHQVGERRLPRTGRAPQDD